MQHDIESENLAAHVSLCHERYIALERKIQDLESKIDHVNITLVEIRQDLHKIADDQVNRWNLAQIAVIGMLMSIIGALAAKLLF